MSEVDAGAGFVNSFLGEFSHHGVKGMHWGEHKARSEARKDAEEHVKAKLFYGEGAGTRRKLIKARVASRISHPVYAEEFHAHVARQNLEKRANQAVRTRKRRDRTTFVKKTTRGVHRSLTGGFGPVTATAGAIALGATYVHKTGLDKAVLNSLRGK